MANWDDFQELFHELKFEIEQICKALERMRVAFESLAKTYQELIDYCEKNTTEKS